MTPAARREQFIALGRDLIKRVSLDNLSIESVAQAAGVSRALVFHYFSSKQDFHLALAQAQAAELLTVTAPDDSLGEPIDVLRSGMGAFLDFVSEHRHAYTAFLRGAAAGDDEMRRIVEETRTVLADRILDRTDAYGMVRTPTVELAVRGWISFVEEIALSWLDRSEPTRDELLDLVVNSLVAIGGVVDPDGAARRV
ncbi:MAG: TetR/AcrR family transcriptional regulator [Gordonia sp. (in: high G+C Gram-positive bacteria)]